MKLQTIMLLPQHIRVEVEESRSLLEVIVESGVPISADCGGKGTCGKCRVITDPQTFPNDLDRAHLSPNDLEKGYRLACSRTVDQTITVYVPQEKTQAMHILEDGFSRQYPHHPPALANLRVQGDVAYGASVDLGTTTIVLEMIDLYSGRSIGIRSMLNPQYIHGQDVYSRARYTRSSKKLAELQHLVSEGINTMISEICHETKIDQRKVVEVCVAGNTIMSHLLAGRSTQDLIKPPYQVAPGEILSIKASALGIGIAEGANIVITPSASAFIGGDIVAGLVATDIESCEKSVLFIDLGTNGEILLSTKTGLMGTSAAAGPAFEGMNISCGVSAVPGAIYSVSLDCNSHAAFIQTIAGVAPIGFCGSGLIKLISEMLRVGMLDSTGKFSTATDSPAFTDGSYRLRIIGGTVPYLVIEDIRQGEQFRLTQKDVRQLQLAKGAVGAAVEMLLCKSGMRQEDVQLVLLAGAFGHSLEPSSLQQLGLFSSIPTDRMRMVGNTALAGARLLLVSNEARMKSQALVKNIKSLNLSLESGFSQAYLRHLGFPEPMVKGG